MELVWKYSKVSTNRPGLKFSQKSIKQPPLPFFEILDA